MLDIDEGTRRGGVVPADPAPRFTVFTPTRNRAHTLHRVYDSLRAQTFRDFEWLVIDNESTDDTPALIAAWTREADFPIRYIRQVNRGLTVSWNRAVAEARGGLLATLASDDSCYPTALERLWAIWTSIPDDQRDEFASVATLCVNERGELHGDRFPSSPLDASALEMRYRYGVRGEKWGCQRVDILRRYPFPVVDGYLGYMPESIVWDAIARSYKERCVNETLRIFWTADEPSLSRPSVAGDGAVGGMLHAQGQLSNDLRYLRYAPAAFLLAAIRYSRFAFHAGRGVPAQISSVQGLPAKALVLATLPIGFARYLWDIRGRRMRRWTLGVVA